VPGPTLAAASAARFPVSNARDVPRCRFPAGGRRTQRGAAPRQTHHARGRRSRPSHRGPCQPCTAHRIRTTPTSRSLRRALHPPAHETRGRGTLRRPHAARRHRRLGAPVGFTRPLRARRGRAARVALPLPHATPRTPQVAPRTAPHAATRGRSHRT
jgi:hypothetical protein